MARCQILFLISLSFLLPSFISSAGPTGPSDSELFYCVDWDCQEFISRGKTLLNYAGRTDKHLSFRQNEDIKILSKSIDDKGPDWVGMVRKKIGLVPRTMIREDQMGKHMSKFQYPFKQLPLWLETPTTVDADKKPEVPVEKVEEPEKEAESVSKAEKDNSTDVNSKQNDSMLVEKPEDTSVDTEEESAPELSELSLEGNVEEFDDPIALSVEPITDVSEPPQTTVMPDELQKQENIEPTETVDQEMPEVPEATAIISEEHKLSEQQQEIIEPTKSSTLDQIVSTATEVVVEPSEIVDLKDPQDSQEIESQSEPTGNKETTSEISHDTTTETLIEPQEPLKSEELLAESSTPEAFPLNNDLWLETPTTLDTDQKPEILVEKVEEPKKEDPESKAGKDNSTDVNVKENDSKLVKKPDDTPVDMEESAPELSELTWLESLTTLNAEQKPEIPVEKVEGPEKEEEQKSKAEPEDNSTVVNVEENDSVLVEKPEGKSVDTEEQSDPELSELSSEGNVESFNDQIPLSVEPIADVSEPPQIIVMTDELQKQEKVEPTETVVQKVPEIPEAAAILSEKDPQDFKEIETESESEPSVNTEITSEIYHDTTTESLVQLQEPLKSEELLSESSAPEPFVINDETMPEGLVETVTPSVLDVPEEIKAPIDSEPELAHNEEDHHHHHHHHHKKSEDGDSSSFIIVVKHLSSTLLSFLPEHLQDSILDVDDALVFTGIIALTLVSICVPYFLIEGFFSVRPLKKKVVELNKSLWKVSTAYENQQEEFEVYKTKALAYDEDKKRVEKLEYELHILQKLDSKHKEQVTSLKKELKSSAQVAVEVQSLVETTMDRKKKAFEEREKLKTTVASLKEALRRTTDELQEAQTEGSSALMDLEFVRQSNETLSMKVEVLGKEVGELKSKLVSEVDRRRGAEDERDDALKSKLVVETELSELRKICHKYEETVSDLNTEIGHKENELTALKETLGDDSPLVDVAEVKAKLVNAEEEAASLQSRVESFTLENNSLSRNLKEATHSLSTVQKDRDEALNRLQVLEAWFKEKEEELRKAVERYEAEKNIRGKGKDDLVRMIEEKSDESRDLNERIEALKEEFEETKQQHRNEMRALEAKSHEHWLSLCQSQRKAQDFQKEAEFLRQTLTSLTKEKEGDGDELNGDVPMYPLISPDMVPLPLPDDSPSYYGLGEGFIPPPPLPLDDERERHRPAPLGRLSPNYSDVDDNMLSPIRRGRLGEGDYSDGDSSASDSPRRNRRSPRGWVDIQHDRDRDRNDRRRRGPPSPLRASSPITQGFNL